MGLVVDYNMVLPRAFHWRAFRPSSGLMKVLCSVIAIGLLLNVVLISRLIGSSRNRENGGTAKCSDHRPVVWIHAKKVIVINLLNVNNSLIRS